MLAALGIAVALHQGDLVLQYRPDPSLTTIYWFNMTVHSTRGGRYGSMPIRFDISTFEKRTVLEQNDTVTMLIVETDEIIVSAILHGKPLDFQSGEVGSPLAADFGPTKSIQTIDLRGRVKAFEVFNDVSYEQAVHSEFAVSESIVLSPFPEGPLTDSTVWKPSVAKTATLGLFGSCGIDGLNISCWPQLPVKDDELTVEIWLPEQLIAESKVSGEGDAVFRFSTGELKSLDIAFTQTIDYDEIVYTYRARRIAEYAKPRDLHASAEDKSGSGGTGR